MSNRQLKLSVKVQGIAGSDIMDIMCDMVELARRIKCPVESTINGFFVFAMPDDNPLDLFEKYESRSEE